MWKCVTVCVGVLLQCVTVVCFPVWAAQYDGVVIVVLKCVAVCYSVLQCLESVTLYRRRHYDGTGIVVL